MVFGKELLPSRIFHDTRQGKNKERYLLKGFLERLQLKVSNLESSERPDFIVTLGRVGKSYKIGCEITLFYSDQEAERGSVSRRFVEKWRKLSQRLMKRMSEEGGGLQHLFGSVFFRQPSMNILDKINEMEFIDELVKISKDNIPKKAVSITDFDGAKYPLLKQMLERIFIENLSPQEGILWWPAHLQTGEIPDPRKALVSILRGKNETAASYQWSGIRERWLIVVAEALALTDVVVLTRRDFQAVRLKGGPTFTRVYLWDRFLDNITELFPSVGNIFVVAEEGKGIVFVDRLPRTIRAFVETNQ